MVVAITFAIRRDMGKLYFIRLINRLDDAFGKAGAVVQKPFECHALRNVTIVEKDRDTPATVELHLVWTTRVNGGVVQLYPAIVVTSAYGLRLTRRQNGKLDIVVHQNFQRSFINGSLG